MPGGPPRARHPARPLRRRAARDMERPGQAGGRPSEGDRRAQRRDRADLPARGGPCRAARNLLGRARSVFADARCLQPGARRRLRRTSARPTRSRAERRRRSWRSSPRCALGESLDALRLAGLGAITAGMFVLAAGPRPPRAIARALRVGVLIAAYTVVDGIGVRHAHTPLGYGAWLFVSSGVLTAIAVRARERAARAAGHADRRAVRDRRLRLRVVGADARPAGRRRPTRDRVVFGALIGVIAFHEQLECGACAASALVAAGRSRSRSGERSAAAALEQDRVPERRRRDRADPGGEVRRRRDLEAERGEQRAQRASTPFFVASLTSTPVMWNSTPRRLVAKGAGRRRDRKLRRGETHLVVKRDPGPGEQEGPP